MMARDFIIIIIVLWWILSMVNSEGTMVMVWLVWQWMIRIVDGSG